MKAACPRAVRANDCSSMDLYEIPKTTANPAGRPASLAHSSSTFSLPRSLTAAPSISVRCYPAPVSFHVGEQIIRLISADN